MSQNDLAARSGVPKPRLSRYENGHILPSLGTLTKLATALGSPESELLGEPADSDRMLLDAMKDAGVTIVTPEEAAVAANAAKVALRESHRTAR